MFPVMFEVYGLDEYLTRGLLYYYDTVYFGASLQNFRSTCCWKYIRENGSFWNTGRFIMFSVITTIYNKKTKGHTLMELFTATGKLRKLFLTTRDFRCVHNGWHGTNRYDIQVLTTHASTWVHRYSSLLQRSVPLGQRVHVAMVGRIICTKSTLHGNHRLTRVIFQHTKRLLPRSGHFLTTHTRIAWLQKCELRWKTTYWDNFFF